FLDCHDLWMSGHRESGVYTIVRDMATKPIYCNMTSSAGWTVLQRRRDGTQDFDREWAEYKNGFGSLYGEFWLGLDDIRYMTHGRSYSLMVMIEDWKGNTKYAMYDQFVVFGQNFV
uniref:Fibrinogen C-terminal domain-containing protein n=1 Tax=Ciona savignyi TaxID=51511 RepID=H2Z6L0_CIOSA